ncbi:MAG TPA: hypothetical protein VK324_15635 [Tepidisphaeraceae bacterium]|nr:hypothetical protein [Tepidisphaeraceae bacterium]
MPDTTTTASQTPSNAYQMPPGHPKPADEHDERAREQARQAFERPQPAGTEGPGHARAGEAGPSAPATPVGESEYLTEQANAAREAISKTVAEIKAKLAEGADAKRLLAEHPWLSLAGATVAGFAAASMVVPSKTESALKRLAEIEQALNRPYIPPHPAAAQADGKTVGKPGFATTLVRELFKMAQPILMSAVTAGVAGKTMQPDAAQDQGTPPPEGYASTGGSYGTSPGAEPTSGA